jgi:hypothetical protein
MHFFFAEITSAMEENFAHHNFDSKCGKFYVTSLNDVEYDELIDVYIWLHLIYKNAFKLIFTY